MTRARLLRLNLGLLGAAALLLSACSSQSQSSAPTATANSTSSLVSTSAPTLQPLPSVPPSAAPSASANPLTSPVAPGASPAVSPAAQAGSLAPGATQVLLSVRQLPPASPSPAAASAASPAAGPAQASVPASAAQQTLGHFYLGTEVIAAAEPSDSGLLAAPGCVQDSVFKRGMKLVFRFQVADVDNDHFLTPDDNATITLQIPNGPSLSPQFRPTTPPGVTDPEAPWTWVATWDVPATYPTGQVAYTVSVTTPDGRSQDLTPFAYQTTLPTIVE